MNREELRDDIHAAITAPENRLVTFSTCAVDVVWPIIQRLQEENERLHRERNAAIGFTSKGTDEQRERAERAEQALQTFADEAEQWGWYYIEGPNLEMVRTQAAVIADAIKRARSVLAENPEET